ncbi:NAD(P)H-binding protein [Kribbella sp.]|uniref:NAD(P)H-binding protein n=1 Tax=Kribbella sp. TaxID=1871183 RepID=UPI002D34AD4A|nr:NAD(P)H-binding protein [Kribbella sp.]HZX02584.1 NAD(P)H-binding protein [Kribbella sp.]
MRDALEGVDVLFVHPRAVGERAGELVKLAAEYGVRRVVVMSAINVDDDPALQPSRWNGDRNREVEAAVVAGELPWVAVRPASFAANVVGLFGAQVRSGDVVRAPYAGFAEALIDEADVSAVLAEVLLDDRWDGQRLAITGPEALSQRQLVEGIGTVLGLPLRFEEVPAEAAVRGMVANGLPEAFAHALMDRYAHGLAAAPTDTVEQVLGRPARTFAQWVAEHRDAFQR